MSNTSVASNASSVLLLEAHDTRNVIICNDDANRLYVLLGAGTASTTNYSFSLAQNENALVPDYDGEINGIWASAGSGGARITTLY